jgi:8-oxo-dGTP pyrophosphatase MutT (NUDIX family)
MYLNRWRSRNIDAIGSPTKQNMRSREYTQEELELHCRCAGVFLTKGDGVDEILLVETHRKKYQYSFPKGKRDKGEDTLSAAKRELLEETGIGEDSYEFISGKRYIEYRPDCDKPHIVYYAARLKTNNVTLAPRDTKEIRSARWFTPTDIYTMRTELYLQRRQIVTKAVRELKARPRYQTICQENFSLQTNNQEATPSRA